MFHRVEEGSCRLFCKKLMYDYCRPPKNQRLVKTRLSTITHGSGREIWKCAYKSQIEYLKALKTSSISQILLTWLHEITFMKVFKGLQIFLGGFHKVEEGSCRLFCKKSIYDYWRLPKKQRLFKTPTGRTTHRGGRGYGNVHTSHLGTILI